MYENKQEPSVPLIRLNQLFNMLDNRFLNRELKISNQHNNIMHANKTHYTIKFIKITTSYFPGMFESASHILDNRL
jgi:hypothetical protein